MKLQCPSSRERLEAKWIKLVAILLYFTVTWNIIEGTSSIYFGYLKSDISLFAFGIDSAIEVFSETIVLFHILCKALPKKQLELYPNAKTPLNPNKSAIFSLETERKLTLFVGCLLVIFCIFAIMGGTFRLVQREPPQSTFWGIVIGGVCIVVMVVIYYIKTKAAVILNSSALMSDAACSFGCTKLSTVLFLGSLVYEVFPTLWWIDAATAIVIGLMVMYEGYEVIKGAKDRDKFQGGCGCCAATESGVTKWLMQRFERQLGMDTTGKVEENCEDECCDVSDVVPVVDDCCGSEKKEKKSLLDAPADNCCGSNKRKDSIYSENSDSPSKSKSNSRSPSSRKRRSKGTKVNSYGAIAKNENVVKEASDCGSKGCCSGK